MIFYFTLPNWSGTYQAPSVHYWGGQSTNWDATSKNSNMTLCDGEQGGWGSTYYIDIDLNQGNITGLIVKFKQNGQEKQSIDIVANIPTEAGEYVINGGFTSWDGNKFSGSTITPKQ